MWYPLCLSQLFGAVSPKDVEVILAYPLPERPLESASYLDLSAHEAAVAARLLSRLLRLPIDEASPVDLDLFDLACRI
jgi:hypothetical protein